MFYTFFIVFHFQILFIVFNLSHTYNIAHVYTLVKGIIKKVTVFKKKVVFTAILPDASQLFCGFSIKRFLYSVGRYRVDRFTEIRPGAGFYGRVLEVPYLFRNT